jgi:cytoplasmic tRNA 2-thiolation protein 2
MAMLDMLLHHGYIGKGDGKTADLTKGEREVLWDKGTVVYVEFAGVTGMEDRMEVMRTLAEEKGLGFVGLRAEEAFDSTLGERLGTPASSPGGIAVDLSNPSTSLSPGHACAV